MVWVPLHPHTIQMVNAGPEGRRRQPTLCLHLVPKITLFNAINSKGGLRRLLVDTEFQYRMVRGVEQKLVYSEVSLLFRMPKKRTYKDCDKLNNKSCLKNGGPRV